MVKRMKEPWMWYVASVSLRQDLSRDSEVNGINGGDRHSATLALESSNAHLVSNCAYLLVTCR